MGGASRPSLLGEVPVVEDFVAGTIQNTFSVAVAAFLLVRMESRLGELSCVIARLQAVIEAALRREGFRDGGEGL